MESMITDLEARKFVVWKDGYVWLEIRKETARDMFRMRMGHIPKVNILYDDETASEVESIEEIENNDKYAFGVAVGYFDDIVREIRKANMKIVKS